MSDSNHHLHIHPHRNSVHHHPHYAHMRGFVFILLGVIAALGIAGVVVWQLTRPTPLAAEHDYWSPSSDSETGDSDTIE